MKIKQNSVFTKSREFLTNGRRKVMKLQIKTRNIFKKLPLEISLKILTYIKRSDKFNLRSMDTHIRDFVDFGLKSQYKICLQKAQRLTISAKKILQLIEHSIYAYRIAGVCPLLYDFFERKQPNIWELNMFLERLFILGNISFGGKNEKKSRIVYLLQVLMMFRVRKYFI